MLNLSETDLNIVELLAASFNSERMLRDLAKFIAPDFTYDSLVQGRLNFDQYCSHAGATLFDCEYICKKVTQNNGHFEMEVMVHMLDNQANVNADFIAYLKVYVLNGLVMKMTSTYQAEPEQLAQYKEISSRYVMADKKGV